MEHRDVETSNVFPPNMEDIRKRLLDALECKDFQLFERIVEKNSNELSTTEIVTYVSSNEKDTYLDIACRKGLTNFVEFLLDKGAKINRVNDEYDCAPIHFAVKGGYVDILEILFQPRRPSQDIAHGEDQRIDPNLEVEQRTALHIAVEENYEDCASLLLENNASANILNSKNQTALHVAARKKDRHNMVTLILDKCTERLKMDRYKDNKDQTTRQIIVKKWPEMENELLERIPIEGENLKVQDLTVQDLKYHLNNTDEESFLSCMEVIKEEIPPNIAQTLLTVSVQHNFPRAVTAILEKFKGRPLNMKKAVCVSIQKGHYVILEKLLKAGPQMTNELKLILKVCQEMGIPREGEDNTNLLKCLELMLEQNANVRCSDEKGNTPLHYAARADNREAMRLLLERGSYIGQKNRFNVPPIMNIPVCTLRDHFDDCLKMKDRTMKDEVTKEQMHKYVIEFDYSCLKPPKNFAEQNATHGPTRETEVFLLISENKNLKHLLKHPLLSSFLYLKWLKIRNVLYANFVFYFCFYVLLNAYILCTTDSSENPPNGNGTQIVNNCVDTENNSSVPLENTPLIYCCPEIFLQIFVIIFWLLFTVREIFQCACSPYRYVKDWENWLQVILIIFILIFLCGVGLWSGVMVIILSALELITLISQHPKMSAIFEMFRTVSLTYIRLLFPYTFLIIAFALAFYALFKDASKAVFPNVWQSVFKTSIMITGEFNSSDIPFCLYPVCSRIVFVLFVFLIAIVLFNLLNGLAVSDTSEIRSKAELIGLTSRIRMIVYLEDIAFGKPFSWFGNWCLSQWNPFRFLIDRILLFPNYLKDGKVAIVYDNLDVHKERYNVRGHSMSNNENWSIDLFNENLEMDSDIIEQTKRIIFDKNQLSDIDRLEKIMNDRFEKIMNDLNKLQKTLITIEDTLKKLNHMT